MKKIKTKTLQAGQIFTAPVYSEGDNLLVPARVPLRQRDIDLLYQFKIDFVITDGVVISPEEVKKMMEAQKAEEIEEIAEVEEIAEAEPVEEADTPKEIISVKGAFGNFGEAEADKVYEAYEASVEAEAISAAGASAKSEEAASKAFDAAFAEAYAEIAPSEEFKNAHFDYSDIFDDFTSGEDSDTGADANVGVELNINTNIGGLTEDEQTSHIENAPPPQVKFSLSDVQQNSGTYRSYRGFIDKLNGLFTALSAGTDIEMRSVDNIASKLLQEVREHPNNFVDYILGGEIKGHELAKSSVNTAILSAITAHELKLPNHKILHVVNGALLHDVGMLRLSRGITEKKGGLSDAELEQIKSHPLHSSKIVTKELFGPHDVNLIALHHHERWDGQGYPDHIMGPAIDIGARIVSVADAFEAMVSKKSYRNSMLGYQAVKNLLSDNARRFDPAVIMAFTKIMGIYPIGSIVRLNDTSVARVVNVHSDAPLRPVVEMLVDKDGKVLKPGTGATVNLLQDKKLFIKNAIDPAEFAGSNA